MEACGGRARQSGDAEEEVSECRSWVDRRRLSSRQGARPEIKAFKAALGRLSDPNLTRDVFPGGSSVGSEDDIAGGEWQSLCTGLSSSEATCGARSIALFIRTSWVFPGGSVMAGQWVHSHEGCDIEDCATPSLLR